MFIVKHPWQLVTLREWRPLWVVLIKMPSPLGLRVGFKTLTVLWVTTQAKATLLRYKSIMGCADPAVWRRSRFIRMLFIKGLFVFPLFLNDKRASYTLGNKHIKIALERAINILRQTDYLNSREGLIMCGLILMSNANGIGNDNIQPFDQSFNGF